ncbi:MAG TPA: hypothetical protein VJS64_04840, partial [Pyrinomonadaceae bacterium]|nr:hypothetical protein [Pyrinomonadaceae bacterium]
KPPFKYRPAVPVGGRTEESRNVTITGSADVLALYSDVFLVVNEVETGMASIFFYQRQISDRGSTMGTTHTGNLYASARCISRIVMSKDGIEKLLGALAENRGYTLTPKPKAEDSK